LPFVLKHHGSVGRLFALPERALQHRSVVLVQLGNYAALDFPPIHCSGNHEVHRL